MREIRLCKYSFFFLNLLLGHEWYMSEGAGALAKFSLGTWLVVIPSLAVVRFKKVMWKRMKYQINKDKR